VLSFLRYDRIATRYGANWPLIVPGYVPILNAMVDIIRALADRPREVLDLGCGPGSATIAVAPACHPEGSTTLVDGSSGMLAEANRILGTHVRCSHEGDFTQPDLLGEIFVPETYDLVLASFALHHIGDQEKRVVIEAAAAALRPGCVMLIAEEIAIERPAGWDVVERIRGRVLEENLRAGRIEQEFWSLETSHPAEAQLPFLPARVDDVTSWMARAGLAVTCPVSILGSALILGTKPPPRVS